MSSDYKTFQPVLYAGIHATAENVLILGGAGSYLGAVAHLLKAEDRNLTIAVTDYDDFWLVEGFESSNCQVHMVQDWSKWTILEARKWSIVLIAVPEADRDYLIRMAKDHAELVIVHNVDVKMLEEWGEVDDLTDWEEALLEYPHRTSYAAEMPVTSVVSATRKTILEPVE